ncbi:MAG: xanthine dehydrogenase family protein molybdopterin-binding subunit [Syntrophomonas sp.]
MYNDLIGKSVPMVDGFDKVAGRHLFTADMQLPGMLYGKVLRSPYPHARIVKIDTSKAKTLMGVRTVITGRDMEFPKYGVAGQRILDEQLLAVDKVRYVGDEVAVVAATDPDTALQALDLIKVEYEPLAPLFDPREAMESTILIHEEQNSNVPYKIDFTRGDIAQGFSEATVIVEDSFYSPLHYQAYLEPHAAVADCDARGRVCLWIPTQTPALARGTYANALGIGEEELRVIQMPVGGGFGGKLEYKLHALCALLARATRRPVKMVNTREEDFQAGLPRVPMYIKMKLGVRKDGTLAAKQTEIVADNGAYINYSHGIMLSAAHRHDNLYRIKNIATKAWLVYTNKVATGCFRGFGNPQIHFAYESILDMAAEQLGMDPAELRLINSSQPGDFTPHGWKLLSCGLSDCIKQSVETSRWKEKRARQLDKNERFAQGIGIGCCLHVSGNRTFLPDWDGAFCNIRIDTTGKAIISPGETDLGQGSRTTFAQIAASELGFNIEDVSVRLIDTDTSPLGLGTFGDRATTLGGNAVRMAAIDARNKIIVIAAQKLELDPSELFISGGICCSKSNPDMKLPVADIAKMAYYQMTGGLITGHGSYAPPDVRVVDPDTKYGNISAAYPFVTQIVEVEVDRWTGKVRILNVVSAHDLGKTLNPLLAEGQVQGAIAQGIGFALMEDMGVKNGVITNRNFERYNMPRIDDMAPLNSILLVESNDPNGPYGAKGLAEPAFTAFPAAVANAIYHAVGVRIKELPITPEKVLKALQEKEKK